MARNRNARPRLRGFVAMAFGRQDTDRVYDKAIAPTLKRTQVTPVRVDRIEHQDDVDDRIVMELERCDFAVADLTYARPSVYWEAGYAERRVPVIYTCRKDHLSPRSDDEFGNRRVHFDLQMRNIIPWRSPSDEVFVRRLERRIGIVTQPLLRNREDQERTQAAAARFGALSVNQKTAFVLTTSERLLKRAGFRGRRVDDLDAADWAEIAPVDLTTQPPWHPFIRLLTLRPGWIGLRLRDGQLGSVAVHIVESMQKRAIQRVERSVLSCPAYNLNYMGAYPGLQALSDHIVLCSLRPLPISRLAAALPAFHIAGSELQMEHLQTMGNFDPHSRNDEIYVLSSGMSDTFFARNRKKGERALHEIGRMPSSRLLQATGLDPGRQVRRQVHLRVIDRIRSEQSLREALTSTLSDIASEEG